MVRRLLKASVGVGLVVLGSVLWNSRVPDFNDEFVKAQLSESLREVPAGSSIDISSECERQTAGNGWILFVLDANLVSDDQFRSYFETASERMGIWITYDAGYLRLGLGSGPSGPDSNRTYPIRTVRRSERVTILVGVSRNETRVVTSVRDFRVAWPAEFATGWSCEYVQFGDETNLLSEEAGCKGCGITLHYATGADYGELTTWLDEVSDVSTFNQRRLAGSGLTLLGAALILARLPRSRQRKDSGDAI